MSGNATWDVVNDSGATVSTVSAPNWQTAHELARNTEGFKWVELASELVTTWADSSGVWHCRIEFPSPGYGPGHLERHHDRIRAKARRAIRTELAQRENLDPGWRCRIEVSDNDLDHMNVMRSLTFREVTA